MNKINQHMYVEFTFDVEVEDGVGDGVVEDVGDVGGVEAVQKFRETLEGYLKRINK